MKCIVNFAHPISEVPPFSELKTEEMTNFLNHAMKFHWIKQDLEWQLAFKFHLFIEDAEQFVADWRKTL
jgi:hypothetical protein